MPSFSSRSRQVWPLPRFSLKAFLLVCVFVGVTMGWISRHYHEYNAEQRFIAELIDGLPKSTSLTVTTNGVHTLSAGNVFS